MDAQDPSQLRISDYDRHKVAEVLREAAGEGRIDFEELDQRLEATYAARTYADLVPITLDLPIADGGQPADAAGRGDAVAGRPGRPAEERHLAILSGLERKGVWVVPQHLTVTCFMGGADLDLRRAQFAAREVVHHGQRGHGRRRHQGQPAHPRDHGGHRDHGRLQRPVRHDPTRAGRRTARSSASAGSR